MKSVFTYTEYLEYFLSGNLAAHLAVNFFLDLGQQEVLLLQMFIILEITPLAALSPRITRSRLCHIGISGHVFRVKHLWFCHCSPCSVPTFIDFWVSNLLSTQTMWNSSLVKAAHWQWLPFKYFRFNYRHLALWISSWWIYVSSQTNSEIWSEILSNCQAVLRFPAIKFWNFWLNERMMQKKPYDTLSKFL